MKKEKEMTAVELWDRFENGDYEEQLEAAALAYDLGFNRISEKMYSLLREWQLESMENLAFAL